MTLSLPTAQAWAQSCADDGEFVLAARHWNGGLKLRIGEREVTLAVADGSVSSDDGVPSGNGAPSDNGVLEFSGRGSPARCSGPSGAFRSIPSTHAS